MQKSAFFNSIDGDRRYKAEEWAEYFAAFIGNGVFPLPSNGLQVIANNSMTLTVKAGRGWINGYFFLLTADLAIPLDTADGVLGRYDRVVLRWDLQERAIYITVKKGALASKPSPPAIQRDADAYELVLGDALVEKGVVALTQSKITDRRYNTELCGMVAGVVQQIDVTTITAQFDAFFAEYSARIIAEHGQFVDETDNFFKLYKELTLQQYNAFIALLDTYRLDSRLAYEALLLYFESFKTQSTAQFTEWFESIKGLLSEDIAGSLGQAVLDLQERVRILEDKVLSGNMFTTKAWLGDSYLGATYMTDDTGEEKAPGDTAAWCGNSYLGSAYLVNTTS